MSDLMLFCGSANLDLTNSVSKFLGIPVGKVLIDKFSDGESNIRIIDNFLQCSGAGIVMIIGFSASWDEMVVFLVISQILGLISEGFGLSICIFVKRIPDLGNIINYILLLMFFASPVLYPLNMAEGLHLEINKYNPFVYFVESMREYSNLGSMIFEIDIRITAAILFLISVISFYGYKNMDNIRWEVSTWS